MADVRLVGEHDLWEQHLVLDKLKVRLQRAESIGETTGRSLEFATWRDVFCDRMVFELQAEVLAEKLVDKTVTKLAYHRVDVHTSWWQHFKDDVLDRYWLTKWFVRWRPVKFEPIIYSENLTANFKQYATFPAADIATPDHIHKHIIVAKEQLTWT